LFNKLANEKQIKALDLCNTKEQKDYIILKDNIERNNTVSRKDITAIVTNVLMYRDKFAKVFTWKIFFLQLLMNNFKCCVRKNKRNSINWKYTQLYNNGMNRYYTELDIVKLLKTVRLQKMLFWSQLKSHQRVLMQI
jgi:hypothetical protein